MMPLQYSSIWSGLIVTAFTVEHSLTPYYSFGRTSFKHGNDVKRRGYLRPLFAGVFRSRLDVAPRAFRQVHRPAALSGLQHGRYQISVTEHIRIFCFPRHGIVWKFIEERPHERR